MRKAEARDIVLVVDDSPGTLGVLTEALEDAGMTVLVARDSEQALSIVGRIAPDVILMDAMMPGVNGFETCKVLKQNKAMAHIPIIFMTGLSDTDHIVMGLEAGGVDYVTKPISPNEIIARIRVHLANARMTHSARLALDVFGRFLLATTDGARVVWCTPQAGNLLFKVLPDFDSTDYALPPSVQHWLHQCIEADTLSLPPPVELKAAKSGMKLSMLYVGRLGENENLLRLLEGEALQEQTMLKQKLALTDREAEVLLWITRGKSNRDIGEILNLSPRTVNKHLEQVFAKLGVENRTSAAALAVRTIGVR